MNFNFTCARYERLAEPKYFGISVLLLTLDFKFLNNLKQNAENARIFNVITHVEHNTHDKISPLSSQQLDN